MVDLFQLLPVPVSRHPVFQHVLCPYPHIATPCVDHAMSGSGDAVQVVACLARRP